MLLVETQVSRKEGFLAELAERLSLNKTTLHGLLALHCFLSGVRSAAGYSGVRAARCERNRRWADKKARGVSGQQAQNRD